MLQRGGQPRQEVELTCEDDATHTADVNDDAATGSTDSTDTLPRPLCPDGSPVAAAGEPAAVPPPAPGQSALARILEDDKRQDPSAAAGGEPS